MSAQRSDRLRRFDDVFRTLLVIASILISGAFAFYRELLPWEYLSIMGGLFAASICAWAFATLCNGASEIALKILAWYFLMSAFIATMLRMVFYATPSVPKLGGIAFGLISFVLSYPMIFYFKDIGNPTELKALKITFIIASVAWIAFVVFMAP